MFVCVCERERERERGREREGKREAVREDYYSLSTRPNSAQCAHAHTHARTRTHTHAYTHSHIHTLTHIHTHTKDTEVKRPKGFQATLLAMAQGCDSNETRYTKSPSPGKKQVINPLFTLSANAS